MFVGQGAKRRAHLRSPGTVKIKKGSTRAADATEHRAARQFDPVLDKIHAETRAMSRRES
jgi:hypothetical protein